MILQSTIARLSRLQHNRTYKIIASCLVIALAAAAVFTFVVSKASLQIDAPGLIAPEASDLKPADAKTAEELAQIEALSQRKTSIEVTNNAIRQLLAARTDTAGLLTGVGIVLAIALGVIWLGQSLSVLAVLILIAGLALPLWIFGTRRNMPGLASTGRFIAGVGVLAVGFVVLMELLRAALSLSNPITAIARNVVNESVRMKVSLVFIVLLLFALAAIPGLLDEDNPLRYRVQSFLQYGTGFSFWIIGILTVFLAVGTVAFEQRDRVIWQTMTKPVSAWQYLLGKWLGVSGVAAVLLGVSASGVFLFTEYLSEQRASGEVEPFVSADGRISEDRFVLQSQVLSARQTLQPIIPQLKPDDLSKEIDKQAEKLKASGVDFRNTPAEREQLVQEHEKERAAQYFTIEPGSRRGFQFAGLGAVRDAGKPVILRYRVSVGADDPRRSQRVTFVFPNLPPRVQEVPLGQTMSLDVTPAAIDSNGTLDVMVINADVYSGEINPDTMNFPPDGLEVFYPAGSYRANYFRAMVVLWLKLSFLAMIGIVAATFLSFPVASLVAFGTFLIAESTGFLANALDSFYPQTAQGGFDYWKVPIRAIAVPVTALFKTYADLAPTTDLVEGRMLPWSTVVFALAVLGGMTILLYLLGTFIFSKRELATYSGQ